MRTLRNVLVASLSALPFMLVLPGCGFSSPPAEFDPGPVPHTGVIFCNIETSRTCATADQIAMGIDVMKQYEQGFWAMPPKSGYGLDYSSTTCGGGPQVVTFDGPFPAGTHVCVSPTLLDAGGAYADASAACKAYCESRNGFDCENDVHPSLGAENVTPGGCPGGSFDAAVKDLRTFKPRPVVWRDALLVDVMGNGLTRLNAPPAWNAGAASTTTLSSGFGYVDFTAIETNRDRMCGLTTGALPDNDPSFTGISFAVDLLSDGTVKVLESGVDRGVSETYASNDVFRVAVVGGVVQYFKNGKVFYTSASAINYPLHVDASLFAAGATLANVNASF